MKNLLSICLCTYKRPELLSRLLSAICKQDIVELDVEVCIVDNDILHSAEGVLKRFQLEFGDRLRYIHLPVPNISLARNATIELSKGDWLVFVDDDEEPNENWLKMLWAAQEQYRADAVFAPVVPRYEATIPAWIVEGKYFERRRLASGTIINHKDARSGNVLIRRKLLDQLSRDSGQVFDPAYGKTGGEDSILFRKLDALGAKMVWCDDAPVYEEVPPQRANAAWLLNRSFRTGQLFMRAEIEMSASSRKISRALWLSFRAIVQSFVAFLLLVLCLVLFRRQKAFFWLRVIYSQLGKLSHLSGKLSEAYGT